MAELEIQAVEKTYRRRPVLRGVSLSAEAGSCIGILGSNGSGKSTLLGIIGGVIPADAGSILWRGSDLLKDRALCAGTVGYVPQGTPLFEELTARDNLRLWYDRHALDRELDEGVLSMLGIGEFLSKRVSALSGGMKKRLSIGCAMANDPALLLLDEPSTALDLACKAELLAYFKRFRDGGGTILMATHDLAEIAMCDALYLLHDGILVPYVWDGDAARLAEMLA